MRREHKGGIKQFYIHTKMWWARSNSLPDNIVDEIMIGIYHPDGGTTGEFGVEFVLFEHNGGRGAMIAPRLRAFDDGWSALAHMPELLHFMMENDSANLSVDAFAEGLRVLGFVDKTLTADQYAEQQNS